MKKKKFKPPKPNQDAKHGFCPYCGGMNISFTNHLWDAIPPGGGRPEDYQALQCDDCGEHHLRIQKYDE